MGDGATLADDDVRELRVAPVMTGGTSLAVWMGGATAELYRMARSRTEIDAEDRSPDRGMAIYRALLELTNTRPVVDVITGTSAGGLNGTLLSVACALGVSAGEFMTIRKTWLDVADLEQLFRSAKEPDPPSLLKGDDYFVPKVRQTLAEWAAAHPITPDAPDIDVVITVTTITPEPTSRTDHFGDPVNEVDHAQCLRFTTEHFRADRWLDRLAIAARTSASIPGVFEPSFLPVSTEDEKASGRPNFKDNASFKTSRWAIDGGVVVNLPLTEALDRIFDRSAERDVRRVVLYVSPTPSAAKTSPADALKDQPDIRRTLTTVVTAPRAEGISADIDLIERNNLRVRRQEQTRRFIGPWVQQLRTPEQRESLFELYRQQRADTSVRNMLDRLQRATAEPLPVGRERIEPIFAAARLPLLPETPDELVAPDGTWRWGIAPVEQAVSLALSIIDRTHSLTTADMGERRVKLDDARRRVHEARRKAGRVRKDDDSFWETRFRDFENRVKAAKEASASVNLRGWAAMCYSEWPGIPDPAPEDGATSFTRLRDAHRDVALVLRGVRATVKETAEEALSSSRPTEVKTAEAVLEELSGLFDEQGDLDAVRRRLLGVLSGLFDEQGDLDAVQRRLLEVHVAQTMLLVDVLSREQRVEFMQLSWNSWNGLDETRTPTEKLAGPELARLGAFLKPSWRANDWFWGRMDAAYRLVLLLLDPVRLRQLGKTGADIEAGLTALVGSLPPEAREELSGFETATELDHTTFQATVRAVAREVQTIIAQDELDNVADAVEESTKAGGNEVESRVFRREVERATREGNVIVAAAVPGLVQSMRIGMETVRTELGFGLMNRVMSRGASVAVNALTGTRSGVPLVSRLLRPLRAPLQGVNSLIGTLTGSSKLARGLTALILAVAGAVVAVRIVGGDVPGGMFAVSALLMIGVVGVAMLRSGFIWLTFCFAVAAAVIGLTLAGPGLREVVYSSTDDVAGEALPEDTRISMPASSVLQLKSGSPNDKRTNDIELDGRTTLMLRTDEARTLYRRATGEELGWKKWGFLNNGVNVFNVGLALLIVLGFVGSLGRWERISGLGRAARIAGVLVGVLVVAFSSQVFERVLTGRDPVDDGEGLKFAVVELAEDLHGYRLGIVLLALAGTSVLIGLGTDLTISRAGRWVRRYALRAWQRSASRLEEHVGATKRPA